jgi:hypothetical protein
MMAMHLKQQENVTNSNHLLDMAGMGMSRDTRYTFYSSISYCTSTYGNTKDWSLFLQIEDWLYNMTDRE